jgi:hypothetical protein
VFNAVDTGFASLIVVAGWSIDVHDQLIQQILTLVSFDLTDRKWKAPRTSLFGIELNGAQKSLGLGLTQSYAEHACLDARIWSGQGMVRARLRSRPKSEPSSSTKTKGKLRNN